MAWGRHIIGGEITYECIGPGQYRFTMLIYRDCACTGCASFDEPAQVAIYRCGGDTPCSNLNQRDPVITLQVSLQRMRAVAPPDYPCLILPPNICVQEGLYVFSANLPISQTDSYHVVYQRCCRNITINNIVDPDDAGATYSVEITPMAQQSCNNSPVFNEFPPTVICANQPIDFDHSATDIDGDQLVYEFCTPLLGGGKYGTAEAPGNASSCDGVQPTPPCPPPYGNVTFILPNYSSTRPMGGDPIIRIDPNTGVITGTPRMLGQYVVGVCVREYRNGVLIGEVRRDFQFNVANCEPTVIANIQSDSVVNQQDFIVTSCGDNTIDFVNKSYQRQFISQFQWQFFIDENDTLKINDWDARVTFPEIGKYEGRLILNPGTECGDTANIFVNIFPEVVSNFSFAYDTCVAGPVNFTQMAFSGSGQITSYNWSFGDGNTSAQPNPSHRYGIPGDLPVTLTVRDSNFCVDAETKIVRYFPVPALIVIAPNTFIGCQPANIFFDNLSTPIDDTYDIRWEFGDGSSGTEISPFHIYENPGIYTVSVAITSPIGCQTDTTFTNLIEVRPSPTAAFTYSPSELSNFNSTATFTDQSLDAARWSWDFSGLGTSSQQNPVFTFPDTGRQVVQLVVVHEFGCTDTTLAVLDIIPQIRYFLPNAFTPNNDGANETFLGKGVMEGATNFTFTIWNRWGELIFQTNDPEEGWNGRKNNTGEPSPNGVYVYVVKFNGPRGEPYELKGFATLIR